MKKIFGLLFLLIGLIFSQNVTVTSVQKIDRDDAAYFCFPKFSPDGSNLYFTGANYRGLWQYNLENNTLDNINEYDGSGYEPQILNDKIVFRTQEYIDGRKYTTLRLYDLISQQESVITEKKRHLNSVNLLKDGTVFYTLAGIPVEDVVIPDLKKSGGMNDECFILNDNAKLVIVRNSEPTNLTPVGAGNYIWCSLSPDQDKILFTVTGRSTYISDLDGNILTDLGYANAPQWSPDGKWIVYMNDKDDGHKYIASDIFISSFDGLLRFKLTDSDYIAMYPSWSPAGDQIAYHSDDGHIFLMNLSFRP